MAFQTGSLGGRCRHPCSGSEDGRCGELVTWTLGQCESAHGQSVSAGEEPCRLSLLETEDAPCLVVVAVHGELPGVRLVVDLAGVA